MPFVMQNLDDMAMDVDEEDAGNLTQKPRAVDDYGVELDYEELDEEEREVRAQNRCRMRSILIIICTGLVRGARKEANCTNQLAPARH